MANALSKRLKAIEERRKPATARPRLIVPPRDRTPEDCADFDAKFAVQQTKLVADARSIQLKEAKC